MANKLAIWMNIRRSFLVLVIAGVIGTLHIAANAQLIPDVRSAKRTLDGTWKVTITPGPAPFPLPPTVESIVTYTSGGGLIETDNFAVPGSIAGPGIGTWEFLGGRQFRIGFVKYLFTTQGLNQGAVRLVETIVLDRNDEEYTGEGRLETLSPTGAVVLVIPATTHAKRLGRFE